MRLLTPADIPRALELTNVAGWNQTPDDWGRMIQLEPLGCFCVEEDDRIVATTTLLSYGIDLAWLGMVLTHPEYRRKGHARRLVTAALELAAARGIRTVKLDATDVGRPLYRDLGFEDEQPIERWMREPAGLDHSAASLGSPYVDMDRRAFGTDRSRFLRTLGDPYVAGQAYVYSRPGAHMRHLGPCVATNVASAFQVISAALCSHIDQPWFWDILPANAAAVAIASSLGFRQKRRLSRMVKGIPWRGDDNMVYAIAGFEAG